MTYGGLKLVQRLFKCGSILRGSSEGFLTRPILRNLPSASRAVHATNVVLSAAMRFTKKHEWLSVTGNTGTVGISDYAQDKLGELVFIELPEVGKNFEAGDEAGILESVKAASGVFSPVTGEVLEVNNLLDESPSLVNQSCYDKGWIYKVKINDPNELENLMNEENYMEYLKTVD